MRFIILIHTTPHPATVLCFSGSDPSGGAGIQADQAAISAMGSHCASVITALTIQNTQNVSHFYPTPAHVVKEQTETLFSDLHIRAIKIGMIGSLENIEIICSLLRAHPNIPVILDPVMQAGGGGALFTNDMQTAFMHTLLPLATLLTPNSIEARRLTHQENLADCAKTLLDYGCPYVLIKGSHENTPHVTNVLYSAQEVTARYEFPRLPHTYHGSGCTLAASIAALMAQEKSLLESIAIAQRYTWDSLAHAFQPGQGQYIPNRNVWQHFAPLND